VSRAAAEPGLVGAPHGPNRDIQRPCIHDLDQHHHYECCGVDVDFDRPSASIIVAPLSDH
jgi:hypothetical protein